MDIERGTARASRPQTYDYYIRMCLTKYVIHKYCRCDLVHIIVVEFARELDISFWPTFWTVVFKTWRWSGEVIVVACGCRPPEVVMISQVWILLTGLRCGSWCEI